MLNHSYDHFRWFFHGILKWNVILLFIFWQYALKYSIKCFQLLASPNRISVRDFKKVSYPVHYLMQSECYQYCNK